MICSNFNKSTLNKFIHKSEDIKELNYYDIEKLNISNLKIMDKLRNFFIYNKVGEGNKLDLELREFQLAVVSSKVQHHIKKLKGNKIAVIIACIKRYIPWFCQKQTETDQKIKDMELFHKFIRAEQDIINSTLQKIKSFQNQKQNNKVIGKLIDQQANIGLPSASTSYIEHIKTAPEKLNVQELKSATKDKEPQSNREEKKIGKIPYSRLENFISGKKVPTLEQKVALKIIDKEPQLPDIKLGIGAPKVEMLLESELKKQIALIENYIKQMKEALLPIKAAIEEEKMLEKKLNDSIDIQRALQTKIKNNEQKILILSNNEPCSYLELVVKKGEEGVKVPFFTQEEFERYNDELRAKGLQLLNEKYLKSYELRATQKMFQELKESIEIENKNIESLKQQLKKVQINYKIEENTSISKEYQPTLDYKEEELAKWERALKTRIKQLTPNSQPNKSLKSNTNKITINSLVTDPNILKQFPAIIELKKIEDNTLAKIELTKDRYREKLIVPYG